MPHWETQVLIPTSLLRELSSAMPVLWQEMARSVLLGLCQVWPHHSTLFNSTVVFLLAVHRLVAQPFWNSGRLADGSQLPCRYVRKGSLFALTGVKNPVAAAGELARQSRTPMPLGRVRPM